MTHRESDLHTRITLKHGAGGRAMRALIESLLATGFDDIPSEGIGLSAMDDGAAIKIGDRWLVITTDSHVIHPIFFPGGDIGRLSVSGTVNDLAVMGATDVLGMTCAIVLEEGFSRDDLVRIHRSVADTCRQAATTIVTGDTKVMGRGELDGVIINTTGIALTDRVVSDSGLQPDDRILVTGTIGDHGMAVMAVRHNLKLGGDLRSDVAPINGLIRLALEVGGEGVAAMKDPTRGGLSSALHEMAEKGCVSVLLDESMLPISPAVQAAGELLGIDPLHVANEGKAVMAVRPQVADKVLKSLRSHPLGRQAAIIGTCTAERPGSVILDTGFGKRLVSEIEGEPLPRIC